MISTRFNNSGPAAFLIAILAFLCGASCGLRAQNLVADYRFGGSYLSAAGTPPAMAPIGAPGFVSENVDGVPRTVLGFPAGSGCRIPGANAVIGTSYTITVLFRFDDVNSWKRLIDFKNRATDWGLYTYFGNLNFYNIITGSGSAIAAGNYVQVTLTRNAQGNVRGFVNGSPEIEFIDSASEALLGPDRILSFFQDDTVVANEHTSGAVARIRIWDGPLDPAAVATLDRLPGGAGAPPVITSNGPLTLTSGSSFTFTVTATGTAPILFSANSLPAWMSFDTNSRILSGTAGGPGVYEVNVSAFNSVGADSRALRVYVRPATGSAFTFDPPIVRTREDAGSVTAMVIRLGDVSSPATVSFYTGDGTLHAGAGYQALTGELSFAAGVLQKPVVVPLILSPTDDPERDFYIVLSDPSGAAIGTPDRARIAVANAPLQAVPLEFNATGALKWRSVPGVSYQLLESPDLVQWMSLGARIPGTGGFIEYPVVPQNRRYFQLVITPAGL